LSHLTGTVNVLSITPLKYRDYKSHIIETIPTFPSYHSMRLASSISKHLFNPRESNVLIRIRIPRQIDAKNLAHYVYTIAMESMPYFLSYYEPNWVGIAATIDWSNEEPVILSAMLCFRKGSKSFQKKYSATVIAVLDPKNRASIARFGELHRLVWRFITSALDTKTRQEIPITKVPRPLYGILAKIAPEIEERVIEVRVSEAHSSFRIRIPIRSPEWEFNAIPPKLREDLETAIIKPIRSKAPYAPRGMLIAGPPGVGKTVAAEAVAHSLGLKIVEIRPSLYRSMWYGMTEKGLEKLLKAITKRKNIVMLIDDADFLVGRHTHVHETHISEISIFLQYLQQRERPFTIMTTNAPELIDPALIRPGRIDVVLFMGYPDREMRRLVIENCLKRYRIECDSETIDFLVNITRWFTNAEIDALIRLAASKGSNRLDEQSILWARKKFNINEGVRKSLQEQLLWYAQRFQGIVLTYIPKENEI